MRPHRILPALLALLLLPATLYAQPFTGGTIAGTVVDASSRAPLENVSVALLARADSAQVLAATTGKDGAFSLDRIPAGTWLLRCSLVGHVGFRSAPIEIGAARPRVDLRTIALKPSVLLLDEMEIASEKALLDQGIDRRVYNVGKDLVARSGTASDLLQNIPSVQVDLDGNVTLRGSSDVLILVDGKQSPLMGRSRADVLQQLPAGNIEKIEVITNPSARFSPEGTSGIINLVMKKGGGTAMSGDVTGHLGATGRHNENVLFDVTPGGVELYGSYSYRDDLRNRTGTDVRDLSGAEGTSAYRQESRTTMRPQVQMGSGGVRLHPGAGNTAEVSAEYFHRRPSRDGLTTFLSLGDLGAVVSDFDQHQTGRELESEAGITAAFEHDFAQKEHTLRLEASGSGSPEDEQSRFVNRWRTPAGPDAANDLRLRNRENQRHVTLDYARPLGEGAKIEAGYAFDGLRQDIHSDADSLDVARQEWITDFGRTYRFELTQDVHAAYATVEHELGRLSLLGGLRAEYATVLSDLASGATRFDDRYLGLYPTLHLAWKANAAGEVQLNYSRRINRPESDELNPFPEYTDPYNMEAGNPRLRPEQIHSIELGYRWHPGRVSFFPSVYVRAKQDGFTRVTRTVNDSVFVRTMANLASDQSAGFEPVLTFSLGRALRGNLSLNGFYERIDASNIGYAGRKSVVSWSGNGNVNLTPWAATMLQVSSTFRSARLTPQGTSRPSFVVNLGARQNLLREQVSLTFTVSDVFRTMREERLLDFGGVRQQVVSRRDSRIAYGGVTYHFGRTEKKEKDRPFQYDDQP